MKAVFDLDGTLIDSAPDIQAAVNLALGELGLPPLDLPTVTGFIGNGLPVLVGHVRAASGVAEPQPEFVARITVHYDRISATSGAMFPGAAEALAALRAHGWKLGLCTNKPFAAVQAVLSFHDLTGVFDAVLGGDSLPQRKPDPAPLLAVFDRLGAGPAAYVGDSEVDAETATRARAPFAIYTRGYRKTPLADLPHDAAFDHFADLPAILARIAR